MEKFFKKHYKQFKDSLYVTCAILCMLFMTFDCLAFEIGDTIYFVEDYGITDGICTKSDFDNKLGLTSEQMNENISSYYSAVIESKMPCNFIENDVNNSSRFLDYFNNSKEYIVSTSSSSSSQNRFTVQLATTGSFLVVNKLGNVYCFYKDFTDLNNCLYITYLYNTSTSQVSTSDSGTFYNLNGTKEVDNVVYTLVPIYNNSIINTSLPIYYYDENNFDGITSTSQFTSVNNPNARNNFDDIENHLTLNDGSKFYIVFNHFTNGGVYIYPIFDKTQLDSTESLDQYYLRIEGSCHMNLNYSRGLEPVPRYNNTSIENLFPLISDENSNNSLDFTLTNIEDIPVSKVEGGEYVIPLSTIDSSLLYSPTENYMISLTTCINNKYGTSCYTSLTNQLANNSTFEYRGFRFDLSKINSIGQQKILPTRCFYDLKLYVVKKNVATGEESVGDVQSVINFDAVTGENDCFNVNTSNGEQVKQALGTSYVPNDYIPQSNDISQYGGQISNTGNSNASSTSGNTYGGSTTGGSSSIGEGAIVINNNPTFNNTGGGSGGIKQTDESTLSTNNFVLSKIITLIAQNKTSSVNEMEELTGINAWLTVIQTTWSFIPAEVWTVLLVTFTTSMGIMIVTFIIRLVYNFVT